MTRDHQEDEHLCGSVIGSWSRGRGLRVRGRGLRIPTGCHAALTCSTEGAARVVAALGLVRNLPGGTVEVQVSGDPAGLDGHQVPPDSWTREERLYSHHSKAEQQRLNCPSRLLRAKLK